MMGCSMDESSSSSLDSISKGSSQINPPSWIIGSWSDSIGFMDFTFTHDDFIIESDTTSVDLKDTLNSGSWENFRQTRSDDSYSITVSDSDNPDNTGTYSFEKKSGSNISYSISSAGLTLGPFLLNKK